VKRFHVHVRVYDLARSVRFYSELFASAPSILKPDYAKWLLEDPRVNFESTAYGEDGPAVELAASGSAGCCAPSGCRLQAV
jgi:hypothetical protein